MAKDKKRIDPDKIYRSKQMPTTGDGRTHSQKPKLSQTNLPGHDKPTLLGSVLRGWRGKHHRK
jgi:hypothetical protein